mmetsp:Transcript_538/g.1963  ORF Transcript_538/g.1963 Transcript_538/m.1963 type:complete len:270 (+) Transcript_538:391-1200(+)
MTRAHCTMGMAAARSRPTKRASRDQGAPRGTGPRGLVTNPALRRWAGQRWRARHSARIDRSPLRARATATLRMTRSTLSGCRPPSTLRRRCHMSRPCRDVAMRQHRARPGSNSDGCRGLREVRLQLAEAACHLWKTVHGSDDSRMAVRRNRRRTTFWHPRNPGHTKRAGMCVRDSQRCTLIGCHQNWRSHVNLPAMTLISQFRSRTQRTRRTCGWPASPRPSVAWVRCWKKLTPWSPQARWTTSMHRPIGALPRTRPPARRVVLRAQRR